MKIKLKRVYEAYDPADGFRVLVDRLWPRGIAKKSAQIDLWVKELAPSSDLRKWYGHEETKWGRFQEKYFGELDRNGTAVDALMAELRQHKTVTFLYSSKETVINNAAALREYVCGKTRCAK